MSAAEMWWHAPLKRPDEASRCAAYQHQQQLTKPSGALGRLEHLAETLAALQGQRLPKLDRIAIAVFAADHGLACEGVSAYPQAVTTQMVNNFARGGAAISVLAREIGARLEVFDLGTLHPPEPLLGILNRRLRPGTANALYEAAMQRDHLEAALAVGREAVERAGDIDLFIGGEMGIGNTSSATALGCCLLGCDPQVLVGPGTGLDAAGLAHKLAVLRRVLAQHQSPPEPLTALRCVGGFEIAALSGAAVACAQRGVPFLVDGFIATAAVLVAERLHPGVIQWCLFAHDSAEPGHRKLLDALNATALLDLGLRLGEGSGAAVAVPLLRMACALHAKMATFASAGVHERQNEA